MALGFGPRSSCSVLGTLRKCEDHKGGLKGGPPALGVRQAALVHDAEQHLLHLWACACRGRHVDSHNVCVRASLRACVRVCMFVCVCMCVCVSARNTT
eukprot:1151913-Pelagomonas_calceolata.AAC.16